MQASNKRTGQVRLALMLIVGVAAAAACVVTFMWWKAPVAPAQTAEPQPNIIFILTDDMRKDDLTDAYMPKTTTELVAKGMNFQNAFVSNPICCPSRSTIMRGQYAHNTKVWFTKNVFDPDPNVRDGGWVGYKGNGYEDENVATNLQAVGYRTGLFGKYQNGYSGTTKPTKGWDDWFALHQLTYYNYDVNDNGTIKHYGSRSTDYSTDVLNTQVKEFIDASVAQGKPFFAYVAPKAPHSPATPAPRDKNTFNGLKAPRLASFNEEIVSDKPPWIQSLPKLTSNNMANIDKRHENRVESLQAVDDLVGDVVLKLGENHPEVLANTYIFFTSDNGFHHGEHRISSGKGRPYEESVRVPLVIRGPKVVPPAAGQPRLSTDKLVVNTDYFPTFMELAKAQTQTPTYVDGRSLVPVLTGSATTWRTAILIEGRKFSEDPEIPVDVNYNTIRTSTDKYTEYEGGFRELYDFTPGAPSADPFELTNTYYSADPTVSPRPERKARLDALRTCQPQDDKTTPEVEIPCLAAEDAP